jgi:hypothetical protein
MITICRLAAVLLTLGVVSSCGGGGGSTPTAPGGPSTPATGSVIISGASSAEVGATAQLTAEVRNASGVAVVGASVSWSSSDNTVVSVNASGLVTVSKIGPVTITATSGSSSATTTFTGTMAPYTFQFDAAASATDRRTIQDSVQFAHTYFLSTFGRTITQPSTISASTTAAGCASGGSAAFAGAGTITFCVGNPGWTQPGALQRPKIVMHEVFHLLQFEMRWIGTSVTGPYWLVEGAAELVGFQALAARNILTFDTALGCMAKEVADFAVLQPPGLPSLQLLQGPQQFNTTQGPLYAFSMLGARRLTQTAGIQSLITFGAALASGTQQVPAFASAFGVEQGAFYSQWPAHLASIPVPASYLCGG